MILGHLDQIETYKSLQDHRIWKKAFDWLLAHRSQLPEDGEYELEGNNIRAIVQTIDLKDRTEGVFESHSREVDVHCCFSGRETIEWAPVNTLIERTGYDEKKDSTLYDPPLIATEIRMTYGSFVIFFPGDGHMPGIMTTNIQPQVRKIVIKINIQLPEDRQ